MEIGGAPEANGSSSQVNGPSGNREHGREKIASNVIELIGQTPLIELKNIMKNDIVHARLIAKLEFYNPLSSVKDRGALRMIEDAEEKGLLTPGVSTLIEPTSGNLGIGLAYIAAQKGYKFIAAVPGGHAPDKELLLKYLGADVVLFDPKIGLEGAMSMLKQFKEEVPNSHMLEQISNPANPNAHFTGTGPEIWNDTGGKVDILICGSGTGGTISGTGRYLKMKKPSVKVVAVEPSESAVISGGCPGPHKIQGVGPGFIPENLDMSLIDEVVTVHSDDALVQARRLAREEGLLVGISSGAALAACLKVAKREENKGKMIVTIFPSGGERYMTSELFAEAREQCTKLTYISK